MHEIDWFKDEIRAALLAATIPVEETTLTALAETAKRLHDTILGLPEDVRDADVQLALDDLVYDLCGEESTKAANACTDADVDGQDEAISKGEDTASRINNEGAASQIVYITASLGVAEAERQVTELITAPAPAALAP